MVILYIIFSIIFFASLCGGSLSLVLGVRFKICLCCDSSSIIFSQTLVCISVSVLVWAFYYIDFEVSFRRFICVNFLFLGSIFALVFSADLLSLFVAWDLLGFTSFFLVVYYRSRFSLAGGLLTGLTNRIGDVFLLIFFGLVCYGSASVFSSSWLLLLVVGFTKSAQAPFSA